MSLASELVEAAAEALHSWTEDQTAAGRGPWETEEPWLKNAYRKQARAATVAVLRRLADEWTDPDDMDRLADEIEETE